MSIVLTAALPKAKFNRTFCRRTLYAPGSCGGQEIANLKHSQIIAHADTVILHGVSPTLAGQQLRGSLEATKLELGLPGPLVPATWSLTAGSAKLGKNFAQNLSGWTNRPITCSSPATEIGF
jgi:hypothetical protein